MTQTLLKLAADFTVQLTSPVAIGDTTATLTSNVDDDNVALPDGLYGLTIDAGQSNKEYIICTLTGSAVSAVQSVTRQGVPTSGFTKAHRRGAKVTITDWAILSRILNNLTGTTGFNSDAPLGYDGAPSSLTGNQFATVNYVLSVVTGGPVTFSTQSLSTQTSGEALAVNDIVYFKESDQKWYKVDADLTTTFDQLQMGVAQSTVSSNATVTIGISGPMSGFTGLTAGSKYYASNTAGAITTSAGTYSVFVGWALSTTILLFDSVGKTLPTQKEKDALVGSTGIPSSTNKYITQDNVSSATTDQTQTTQNSSIELGEANTTTKKNKLAQSFIPTKTKIRGINLYKSASTGTFTGTVTVSVQADTTGSPSGTPLATATITNANYLNIPVGSFEQLFTSEYSSLTVGGTYWIVIETSTSDNSNHPNLGTNTAGGYANGSVKYKNTTDGWTAISTIDLYFKTLEGDVSQVVSTDSTGLINDKFISSGTLGQYSVGALSNTFVKTYFNIQLPFTLWTGSTNSAATTDFPNWIRSSDVFVPPLGAMIDFQGTGGESIYTNGAPLYTGASKPLQFDGTNIVIMDWWAKLPASSTGDLMMGVANVGTVFQDVYNSTTNGRIAFCQSSAGVLYATISKNGVGNTATDISTGAGLTLTRWNNYRMEIHLGTDVKFYVNNVLLATLSGANLTTSASDVYLGFGRSGTALFQVTAPTISLQMNP